MGFGGAVLLVGVWVLGQPLDSAAFEAPPCITRNNTVLVKDVAPDVLKWAKEGVEAHNKFRKKHGVPPLVLNPNMCKSAQWVADQNAVTDEMTYTFSVNADGLKCGENLYLSAGRHLKPASHVVQNWYNEIKDYDFDKHKAKPDGAGLSFTQVVWKESKEMCMTHAQALSGQHYVVAHYFPMGNWGGGDKNNVLNSANHNFKTGIILVLILSVHLF